MKKEKKEFINQKVELLSKMIVALTRINNGESESQVCRELNINKESFRRILFANLDLEYKSEPLNKLSGSIPTLSPAEVLWCEIMGESDITHIPTSIDKTINKALNTLNHRLRKVIRMRYWERLTLEECGAILNITGNRVRELESKALRKLRCRDVRKYLMVGEEYYAELRNKAKEIEYEQLQALNKRYEYLCEECNNLNSLNEEYIKTLQNSLDTSKIIVCVDPIESLNLTVRTYNCLLRRGVKTVGDLMNIPYQDLIKTRNLGKYSICELVSIMKDKYDFTFTGYKE